MTEARSSLAPGVAAFVAALLVALLGLAANADSPADTVTLRLLGVNDFHGHLEPPRPGLGGAAWLKAHLDAAAVPGRTIRVHAGDMVGASPLLSSHFHDEPTVEMANMIGFDVGTLGNHEFDEGGEELLRLLHGGEGFEGTRFPTIAANTFDRDGRLLLPPTLVVERAGAKVGFIGVTTPSTPRWLLPRHAERFRFTDISEAVDRWVPELQRQGVHAIVVLAHEGAPSQTGVAGGAPDGPILRETAQMDADVDVVVAGHSHSTLNVRVPKRGAAGTTLVVEALSYGVAYDRVDMTVDRRSGDVVGASATLPPTRHDGLSPDAGVAALVARYARLVRPLADRIVGRTAVPLTRARGDLLTIVAEGQRRATGADLALASRASLRADIDAGPITYAEAFEAQSFDHALLVGEMSGAALLALRRAGPELRWAGPGAGVDEQATYTVAASELTAARIPGLRGARRVGSEADALAGELAARRPVTGWVARTSGRNSSGL